MKKFIITICAIFIAGFARADTIDINWMVDGSVYTTNTCTVGGDLILPAAPTKRGYTFNGWKLKYTPVEYIKSTGTQWIDTGIKPNQDTRVTISCAVDGNASHNTIFYNRERINGKNYDFGELLHAGLWRTSYYSTVREVPPKSNTINNKIIIDKNKNVTTIYNESNEAIDMNTLPEVIFQYSYPLVLGGFSTSGSVAGGALKIYSAKIYDNGTLVRDFIPVLDENGVACMYDKVSKTFFYNASTGLFIAGPAL